MDIDRGVEVLNNCDMTTNRGSVSTPHFMYASFKRGLQVTVKLVITVGSSTGRRG
jgi:hypothetical protein